MREIEFKGKRKANGNWVSGSLIHTLKGMYILPTENDLITNKTTNAIKSLEVCEIVPETLSEYTCLKDKNGVKIYEGDILKIEVNDWWWGDKNKWLPIDHYHKTPNVSYIVTKNGCEWFLKNKIIFKDGEEKEDINSLSYYFTSHDDKIYRFVVIGNKWDNPELYTPKIIQL